MPRSPGSVRIPGTPNASSSQPALFIETMPPDMRPVWQQRGNDEADTERRGPQGRDGEGRAMQLDRHRRQNHEHGKRLSPPEFERKWELANELAPEQVSQVA